MTDLQKVLREATDHVASPDLAGRVLAAAHRTRVRRASAGALAAVVLLGGGVAWAVQDRVPHAEVVDTPTPSPDEVDVDPSELPTVPPIELSVVQPLWDPAEVGDLPRVDLGLPESVEPPAEIYEPPIESLPLVAMEAARVVVARDDRFFVLHVAGSGGWYYMDRPDQPMGESNDDLALSRDGTIVTFLGKDGIWSRDLRGAKWRRVDYPDGFLVGSEYGVSIVAQVGEMAWLSDGRGRWQIDVQTGKADRVVLPEYVYDVAFAPGAVPVGLAPESRAPYFVRGLVEMPSGARDVQFTQAGRLQSLTGLAADADSLAATRGVSISPEDAPDDTWRNGLIALRRADWTTRAYLPIRDPGWGYTDGGALRSTTWLDPDTVLATVVPRRSGERTLFTWNVETGELRRVSSLPATLRYDVALDIVASALE